MSATKGHSDWGRRLGLTSDELAELETRADTAQRSLAAEIRLAVKEHLKPEAPAATRKGRR